MYQERRLKRMHLIYYLRVFNEEDGNLLGHLADITTEGLMLVGENPVAPHTDFRLSMTLPEEIGGKRRISFKARSIWSQKDKNPDFYVSGFQIQDISADDVEAINIIIDEYGFLD